MATATSSAGESGHVAYCADPLCLGHVHGSTEGRGTMWPDALQQPATPQTEPQASLNTEKKLFRHPQVAQTWSSWLLALFIYTSVLLKGQPARCLQMIKYMNIILWAHISRFSISAIQRGFSYQRQKGPPLEFRAKFPNFQPCP